MFILIDSDKKFPSTNEIAFGKENILNIIKKNNIPYWVLKKREMENYLPDEVISEIPYNDAYIKAYLELEPIQKDYFDIEKGLHDVNFEGLPEDLKNLYSNLDDDDYKIFRKGSLILYEIYPKKANFKSSFPKKFEDSKVTRNTLSKRDNSNELEAILKKIKELL